jgi:hypothetical protein
MFVWEEAMQLTHPYINGEAVRRDAALRFALSQE